MTDDENKKALIAWIEGSEPKIKKSALFLSLFSGGYRKEPGPLLQLALAIVLDKPIAIIVFDDEVVPEHIKKIAFTIQRVRRDDPGGTVRATKAVLEAFAEAGFEAKTI